MAKLISKSDIIKVVALETTCSKKMVGEVLEVFFSTIHNELVDGNEVSFEKIGKFSNVSRAARTAFNPQDRSKKINVPAHRVVKFSVAKQLRDAVR